jgi:hypothetical protein
LVITGMIFGPHGPPEIHHDLQAFTSLVMIGERQEAGGINQKEKKNGAGEETRTLDIHLGKVTLYQLSYARSRKAGAKIHRGRPQRKTFVHRIELAQNRCYRGECA